jgi:hypothetical protein
MTSSQQSSARARNGRGLFVFEFPRIGRRRARQDATPLPSVVASASSSEPLSLCIVQCAMRHAGARERAGTRRGVDATAAAAPCVRGIGFAPEMIAPTAICRAFISPSE